MRINIKSEMRPKLRDVNVDPIWRERERPYLVMTLCIHLKGEIVRFMWCSLLNENLTTQF